MTADEAARELVRLRGAIGEESPTTQQLWDAFKEFARLPVDEVDPAEDGDRLLFESGVWPSTNAFELGFSRQLFFERDGQYEGMRAIGFVLSFDPRDAPPRPDAQIWGAGGPPWDDGFRAAEEFYDEVEATRVFASVASRRPRAVVLEGT